MLIFWTKYDSISIFYFILFYLHQKSELLWPIGVYLTLNFLKKTHTHFRKLFTMPFTQFLKIYVFNDCIVLL